MRVHPTATASTMIAQVRWAAQGQMSHGGCGKSEIGGDIRGGAFLSSGASYGGLIGPFIGQDSLDHALDQGLTLKEGKVLANG